VEEEAGFTFFTSYCYLRFALLILWDRSGGGSRLSEELLGNISSRLEVLRAQKQGGEGEGVWGGGAGPGGGREGGVRAADARVTGGDEAFVCSVPEVMGGDGGSSLVAGVGRGGRRRKGRRPLEDRYISYSHVTTARPMPPPAAASPADPPPTSSPTLPKLALAPAELSRLDAGGVAPFEATPRLAGAVRTLSL
jgi:hypothetical protein